MFHLQFYTINLKLLQNRCVLLIKFCLGKNIHYVRESTEKQSWRVRESDIKVIFFEEDDVSSEVHTL